MVIDDIQSSADAAAMAQTFACLAGVLSSLPTEQTAATVAGMASALGVTCAAEVALPALERDYADLFVVPNARYVAPYESVYRDRCDLPPAPDAPADHSQGAGADVRATRRGLLMGPSTVAVQRAQLEAGLQVRSDLPDHVANELWFVAHLWRKEAGAAPSERDEWARRRERFIQQHLQQWLGDLTDNVRSQQRHDVYGAALEVAQIALELE